LGVAWVVLQPLVSTLVFTIFLGRFAKVPSDGIPYPLLVFAGLLPWTFFSSALTASSTSMVSSAHLITKVYFPRVIVPSAAIGARLLDFLISFVILIGMMIYYRVPYGSRMLWIPALMVLITLLSLAVGMWLSAMNVKYRDIGVALPVLIMLWMFASPVVYPSSIVYSQSISSTWKFLYNLNPLVGIIDNFRAVFFGLPFNWPALAASISITFVFLVYAAFDFKRMEKAFADII
jgi:lipopolysaccharide transport system permease protein